MLKEIDQWGLFKGSMKGFASELENIEVKLS